MLRQITEIIKRSIFSIQLGLLILLCATPIPNSHARSWEPIVPGIEYLDIGHNLLAPWAHIHVFRIAPLQYQLELLSAKNLGKPYATVTELAKKSGALLAINGGFFDKAFHPLGLRISQNKQYNNIKHISWWGVFFIKNQVPHITSSHHFKSDEKIQFAVQSGPRLIINGKIPRLKPGIAERTAIGITKNNKILLLVTDNAMLSTTELARIMQAAPLSCRYALNLDGGSSSQLFAKINGLHLNVYGIAKISDAVIVKKSALGLYP